MKWRLRAVFYILWWFAIGAPKKDRPMGSRWSIVKWAWETHRPLQWDKAITMHEFLDKLRNDLESSRRS